MGAVVWLFLPVLVAGGSALLSFYIMQARMEVALAKERESLAEARAIINSQRATMEERIRATEEATRRAALDELMRDLRVEERSYMRENKALARKSMVMQERVFFRNIPLSNWTEHEMLVEDGSHAGLPRPVAAMVSPAALPTGGDSRIPISKGLDAAMPAQPEATSPAARRPAGSRENRGLIPAHAAAFGAQ
jgi:hypothetical protein